MSKPSIFSKNYERKMKKRKRLITLTVVLALLTLVLIVFNFKIKNLDFTNVKANIQAWVDSGRIEEEDTIEEPIVENNNEIIDEPEKDKPAEDTYMEVSVADGVIVKIKYVEENGVKQFTEVTPLEGYEFNISPSKTKVIFIDTAQNIKIINIEGAVTDVTKTSYTSTNGTTFLKDTVLAATPTYTWHAQPRFIDENNIAYVSELPYFGKEGLEKYVWIYNIETGSTNTIWAFKNANITLGNSVENKGLVVNVEGVEYYLTADGNVTQKVDEGTLEAPINENTTNTEGN